MIIRDRLRKVFNDDLGVNLRDLEGALVVGLDIMFWETFFRRKTYFDNKFSTVVLSLRNCIAGDIYFSHVG